MPAAQRVQLRDQLGIRQSEAVVLTIGRLSREKGHADLLQALARLPSLPQAWKLVLVGAGPERDALARLAASLEISDRVVFAGFHPDVACFYAIADVFVLPSHSEGSSNVLLEAMMARVPIVATNAGGNAEIVLHENTGLLAPIGDAQGLAAAMARLLKDPGLAERFAATAAARAAQEFSVERYQSRLAGFYAEALGRGSEIA